MPNWGSTPRRSAGRSNATARPRAHARRGLGLTAVGVTPTTQTIDYTYDAFYRLVQADYASSDAALDGSYFTYTYDAVGNRLSEVACTSSAPCAPITTTYSYDNANRLTSVNGQPYTWDANGNLLADGVLTYTYDAANRLITVAQGLTLTTGYAYNGLGDRVNKVVNGVVTTYTLDLAAGLDPGAGGAVRQRQPDRLLVRQRAASPAADREHGLLLDRRPGLGASMG